MKLNIPSDKLSGLLDVLQTLDQDIRCNVHSVTVEGERGRRYLTYDLVHDAVKIIELEDKLNSTTDELEQTETDNKNLRLAVKECITLIEKDRPTSEVLDKLRAAI
jgi:hypothetical protein